MKCVKKGTKVLRLSNDEAAAKVAEGWKYCSKSDFIRSEGQISGNETVTELK